MLISKSLIKRFLISHWKTPIHAESNLLWLATVLKLILKALFTPKSTNCGTIQTTCLTKELRPHIRYTHWATLGESYEKTKRQKTIDQKTKKSLNSFSLLSSVFYNTPLKFIKKAFQGYASFCQMKKKNDLCQILWRVHRIKDEVKIRIIYIVFPCNNGC